MNLQNFNKNTDKIAVVIKEFTMLKSKEPFWDRYSEPYIISFAIDGNQAKDPKPSLSINTKPFPNVRVGDHVCFDGQGHLIYGPKNPGEFLAYTILFMESDQDIRDLGKTIEEVASSEATNIAMKAILAANPTYGTALTLLEKLTLLTAKQMQKNKDDELFRRGGTLLRDAIPPYDILRTYTSHNDFIQAKTSIVALSSSNMLGSQVSEVLIKD